MYPKAMLLGSETLYRLILYFVLHEDEAPHFRALARRLGAGVRPLRVALERLEEEGLIRSAERGNRRVYRVETGHTGWEALRRMVREFADPADVLREALAEVPGVEAAFVFGSVARGRPGPESDVDVLVLGDDIPARELGRGTSESSAVLGREVNVVRYTRRDFARRLAEGNAFARSVAAGPKRWIVGGEESLESAA
jgi:predicted nucleotidyltransferase